MHLISMRWENADEKETKKRKERKSTNSFDGLHTESVITLETAEEEIKPQLELG